jgi:hypothetical protein
LENLKTKIWTHYQMTLPDARAWDSTRTEHGTGAKDARHAWGAQHRGTTIIPSSNRRKSSLSGANFT